MSDQDLKPEVFNSIYFLERKKLLELERELIEHRHGLKMEEMQVDRKNQHAGHLERMSEIRLRSANIFKSLKERKTGPGN